jgi:hypothetical protein
MKGIYVGTIQKVYPPTDPHNSNGYQYEYSVLVTGEAFASIPVNHCIRSDDDGFNDDYEDKILKPSASVLVAFPTTSAGMGIIIGAVRGYKTAMDSTAGNRWRKRYNKFEMLIDQNNNFSMTSDSGPFMQIQTGLIQIDDSAGDNIILDKANKQMTINANKWIVNVVGDATITVGGDLNATVTGKTNITSKGDATVMTEGDATVQAKGNANVKGKMVNLNNPLGMVLTNITDPVIDLITNVPTTGVQTVQAGDGGS